MTVQRSMTRPTPGRSYRRALRLETSGHAGVTSPASALVDGIADRLSRPAGYSIA
jgi:hypothetical protein